MGCLNVSGVAGGVGGMSVPWWARMGIKLAIGMTPFSYEKVRSSVTGDRGSMGSHDYARSVFQKFLQNYLDSGGVSRGGTLLELGPGGSLLTGFLAKAHGFSKCVLIDVGDFAITDQEFYKRWVHMLPDNERDEFESRLSCGEGVVASLDAIGIHYHTSGLDSLRSISPESIHFSFSNAVLEHVRKNDFESFCEALFSAHIRGSISTHQVDYKDHLGGSLNNLRFPGSIWESRFFSNDGFYTNRLRHSEVMRYFRNSGFVILKESVHSWDALPLHQKSMAAEFQFMEESDLRVCDSFITLQKPA
jgi:hypothetical protein